MPSRNTACFGGTVTGMRRNEESRPSKMCSSPGTGENHLLDWFGIRNSVSGSKQILLSSLVHCGSHAIANCRDLGSTTVGQRFPLKDCSWTVPRLPGKRHTLTLPTGLSRRSSAFQRSLILTQLAMSCDPRSQNQTFNVWAKRVPPAGH